MNNLFILYIILTSLSYVFPTFIISSKNVTDSEYKLRQNDINHLLSNGYSDKVIGTLTREDVSSDYLIQPYVYPSEFSEDYTVLVNRTTEYIFEYVYKTSSIKNKALRVTVHCPLSIYMHPLLVVVRQQREVLSWQLPLEPPPNSFSAEQYKRISRTLCRADNKLIAHGTLDGTQRLFIDVTTSSPSNLNFSVQVNVLKNFIIGLQKPINITVSPGEPSYYLFKFPDKVNVVLVKAVSKDDVCAMVSIQNISCPVFDTEENIRYGNFYQTMTLKAGITVRKENYPEGFYIVVVTLSNDDECAPHFQHIYMHRAKEVKISVEEKITYLEYLAAIFAGLGFCAFFYIVAIVLGCIEYIREKKAALSIDDSAVGIMDNNTQISQYYEAASSVNEDAMDDCIVSVCSSLSERDYDILEDAESEKDVFRTKTMLFVSDLSRKSTRVLQHKSFLYILGLLTIAIFYAVPVVQLVATYQKVLDETGNQDICYFNFWCAHPLGPFSDFNHVYSNIGYILFGLLFIFLSARKERRHKKAAKKDRRIDKCYGVPKHFGLFYTMGGALFMEGLLSGCYHICPNHSNFQFDTTFMYVIAVLCMLKIYQARHPDVNASANGTYLVLAFAVLLGVIGVLSGTVYFWVIFAFIHIATCSLLSVHIYYMGRWKPKANFVRQFPAWLRNEMRHWRTFLKPLYCDRMILLLMANAANWGLSIYGVITTPKDFASYLLVIFLTNLMLYTGFYIIMKLRHGEKILFQPAIYIALGMCAWGASAYFFLTPRTTWEMTPAHSREYNRDCSVLHFYDTHDIWHFLSSAAMFFGFMLLLTLDDDLAYTSREKIPVF